MFVTDDHTDREELVRQCLNIGYEQLAGELSGGIAGWAAAGGALGSVAYLDATTLSGRTVVDVRQAAEFAAGHVPGAVHVELGAMPTQARGLPCEPLVVMCGHGERAATGASLLVAAGHTDVAVFNGGPDAWAAFSGVTLVGS